MKKKLIIISSIAVLLIVGFVSFFVVRNNKKEKLSIKVETNKNNKQKLKKENSNTKNKNIVTNNSNKSIDFHSCNHTWQAYGHYYKDTGNWYITQPKSEEELLSSNIRCLICGYNIYENPSFTRNDLKEHLLNCSKANEQEIVTVSPEGVKTLTVPEDEYWLFFCNYNGYEDKDDLCFSVDGYKCPKCGARKGCRS